MIGFDPRVTLQAVVDEGCRDVAADVALTAWTDPRLPTSLQGDEGRLRRALHLLVSHAVNATESGEVRVCARLEERMPDGLRVRFEVTDGGAGLMTDPTGDFPIEGSLRGSADVDLALWKQVVQPMAYELGVRSGTERGNTIWFDVLLEGLESKAAASGGRILVVEDNLVNQKVAMRMIQKLGYAVDVVDDGKAALDALARQHFDLVLMDCQMPVMDGYEATQEIRRRETRGNRTPIVALTAQTISSNRQRCLEIGMDDFVTKPVTTEQLRRVLDDWLSPASSDGR
jgi:CheY-like chemotaxis protein